jgi:GntR family transcriptional regulator
MLERLSARPYYQQLRDLVEERVRSGEWPPGTQLPSERELCEQFGVSRITVRQALAELVMQGQLERSPGRGTFVAQLPIERHVARLMSFTESMTASGLKPGTRVLETGVMPPAPEVAAALQVDGSELVVVLRRLRLVDDEPLAVEVAHLPDRLFHALLDSPLDGQSLYDLLRSKFHVVAYKAKEQWRAASCPPSLARLLDIAPGSPILHSYRTTCDRQGRPFEHVEGFSRGDRHVLEVEPQLERRVISRGNLARPGTARRER